MEISMTTTAIDRAMAGSARAPLAPWQRQRLMARYIVPAWNLRRAQGLTSEPLDAWRREEQFKACGKESLRDCTQQDWNLLCAHFLRMQGRVEKASTHEVKARTGNLAVARHKLEEAMTYAKDVIERPQDYIETISNCKFKTRDLDALSERQIWTLVFDLRRAAQKRRAA
jgi:hypothetical protein